MYSEPFPKMTESPSSPCLNCPLSNDSSTSALSDTGRVIPAWEEVEGTPIPLGVTPVGIQHAWNAAIFSRHATRVTLLFFDDDYSRPAFALELDPLKNKSGSVWHCRIAYSACPAAKYYAWQIDGPTPTGRFDWHAFDAEKILLDPYAQAIWFPPSFDREAAPSRVEYGASSTGRAQFNPLRWHRFTRRPDSARFGSHHL